MRWFRTLFLVGLCLWWGASAVMADEATSAAAGREVSRSDSLLSQLGTALVMLWEESGCRIDPWGACSTTESGCYIDPWGRCSAAEEESIRDNSDSLNSDEGCRIDPWG